MKWEYWYYTLFGGVRHALRYSHAAAAVCGAAPQYWDYWHGTGSQAEYERVASLPACKRCVARGYGP